MKWLWKFSTEQDSSWASIIRSKYGLTSNGGTLVQHKGQVPEALRDSLRCVGMILQSVSSFD
ncbi:hypothetical protein Syun_028293 [Stephania yunnanensis]|uniref:Uncharacterized protein n=1 Tax=Stephania yunnanensis TaxID=152371 RepID=A0AAP0EKH6_9MAGN